MTVTIQLLPATEALLRDHANATGKDISVLVNEIIQQKYRVAGRPLEMVKTAEEFNRLLDEFFAAHPETAPSLPADFSRADIYSDHD